MHENVSCDQSGDFSSNCVHKLVYVCVSITRTCFNHVCLNMYVCESLCDCMVCHVTSTCR